MKDEQKLLEKFFIEEEDLSSNNDQPAKQDDEESAEQVATAVGGAELGDEERVKEADTEREEDEKEFLARFISEEEKLFKNNEQPATEDDREMVEEADTRVGDTEEDEELPEEFDSPSEEDIEEMAGKNIVGFIAGKHSQLTLL